MKRILFTLISMLAIATSTNAMSYEQARNEALFLTDKMAYELNLTDAQYEAAYEINLDYLMSVSNRDNIFGTYWDRRNMDIRYILYSWQWDAFCAATYFYRPLFWQAGYWHFGIYARYPRRDYFYFGRPHFYASYRGGHSWHMNGGRSYYERHHSHYRPRIAQNRHVGMRDGWNRGSYRNDQRGQSSTRVTGRHHDNHTANGTGNRRVDQNSSKTLTRQNGSTSKVAQMDRNRQYVSRGREIQKSTNMAERKAVQKNVRAMDLNKVMRSSSASMSSARSNNRLNKISGSRSTVSGSRSTVSGSRSTVSGSRSTVSGSRSAASSSRSRSGNTSSRGGGSRSAGRQR